MFRTFVKGLVLGAGFSTALLVFGVGLSLYVKNTDIAESPRIISDYSDWNSLDDEEKIEEASAIAIVRYSDGEEGQRIGVIESIHKRTPDTEIHYEEGDFWPSANYYPQHPYDARTGAVVLFKGSPAKDLSTWYVYSERISALGDMPIELLLKKFNEGV